MAKAKKKSTAAKSATAVKKSAKPAPAKKAAGAAKKPTAGAALPGRYDQPLASYSAYAQHRVLLEKYGIDVTGQAKVFKHGTEVLGLPATQVKTYIREKIAAIARDAQKKLGLHPSKPQLEKVKGAKVTDLDIDFRHATRDAAKKAILGIVRRNGMHDSCFHILSEGGKFAVVPAHVRPQGAPPTFTKGDIVMDTTIADSRAEVIEPGPEQSIIRYDDATKYRAKEPCVSNYYLHLIVGEKPAKMARSMAKELAADLKKVAKKAAAPKKAKKKAK